MSSIQRSRSKPWQERRSGPGVGPVRLGRMGEPAVRSLPLQKAVTPPAPIKLVAIGDSLTAGMMDANLDARTESMGYAQQFARQTGLPFNCPVIDGKGVPPRLFNQNHVDGVGAAVDYASIIAASLLPLATVRLFGTTPDWSLWPLYHAGQTGQRTDASQDTPQHPQQNFAVPGFEARHLLASGVKDFEHEIHDQSSRDFWLPFMLPLIHSVLPDAKQGSEVDRAVKADPDLCLVWAGNNDALEPVSGGIVDDRRLTPMEDKKWSYLEKNPITGNWSEHQTRHVVPGYQSTMTGIVERLEKGTHAQIMLFNIPDVTVVPFLRPVGQKVGPLPIRIVLPDGTDITHDIEDWSIPSAISGAGKNGRTVFPPGTLVGLPKLLKKLTDLMDLDNIPFAEAKARLDRQGAVLEENDVLDPDELKQISGRIDQYNALMANMAAHDPRVHVVDVHGLLNDAAKNGRALQGNGAPVMLTNVFCGTHDARGYGGFFSFDGVHPSDVGYSLVANELLRTVQKDLGNDPRFQAMTQVAPIDEKAVYAADPHRDGKANEFVLSAATVAELNALHGGDG